MRIGDATKPLRGRDFLLAILVAFFIWSVLVDDRILHLGGLTDDGDHYRTPTIDQVQPGAHEAESFSVSQLTIVASQEGGDDTTCANHSNSQQQPALKRVALEGRVRTLHMGKSGGGTMMAQIRNVWNVRFSFCHPSPCVNGTYELLGRSNKTAAIILIRDPVQRFLSAFYWRQLIVCDPDGDSREAVTGDRGELAQYTDKYCRPAPKQVEEKKTLFSRYNRDAEGLARALCSSNAAVAEQASSDMKRIGHSMFSISDWVGTEWTKYAKSIYPIILEQDYDFIEEVDDAVGWVYDVSPFEEKDRFLERQASVRHRRECESAKTTTKLSEHSSASIKKTLSEYGSKCIAQYYAADYDILGQMRESACKSDVCRNAIKSILDRTQL